VDELKVIRESLFISPQFFMRAVPVTDTCLYYVAVEGYCLPAQSNIKRLCPALRSRAVPKAKSQSVPESVGPFNLELGLFLHNTSVQPSDANSDELREYLDVVPKSVT